MDRTTYRNVNAAQQTGITFGIGIKKGNPRLCLICRKPIKPGETWTKHTSPADPQYGSYSFLIHTRCNGRTKA